MVLEGPFLGRIVVVAVVEMVERVVTPLVVLGKIRPFTCAHAVSSSAAQKSA